MQFTALENNNCIPVQTKVKLLEASEANGVHVFPLTSSRIEWVWLHWSEYLKASEEFEVWLSKHQRSLDVRIELQLGLKEKLWQVDHQRVVLSDIHGQAGLLERLLDEAAALHNRTQDPSVEAQAQERLQEAYNDVRDRAEVRTAHILASGFSGGGIQNAGMLLLLSPDLYHCLYRSLHLPALSVSLRWKPAITQHCIRQRMH